MVRHKLTGLNFYPIRIILAAFLVSLIAGCAAKRLVHPSYPWPPGTQAIVEGVSLSQAQDISSAPYRGSRRILRLADGTIMIQAGMQIDVDGSPRAKDLDPGYGRLQTSLRFPDVEGQEKYINSEAVPYFVLPLGFAEQHGLELGDIAAVVYNGRLAYAIFADNGPSNKMGEGSIRLAEQLRHAPWKQWSNGESFSTHGGISEQNVLYFIFPGTRSQKINPSTINQTIDQVGSQAFQALGGKILR